VTAVATCSESAARRHRAQSKAIANTDKLSDEAGFRSLEEGFPFSGAGSATSEVGFRDSDEAIQNCSHTFGSNPVKKQINYFKTD
jgi:hypothetical protein